jgi:small-conductance mechanosensitive channel
MMEIAVRIIILVVILLILTWIVNLAYKHIKKALSPKWLSEKGARRSRKLALAILYLLGILAFCWNTPAFDEYICEAKQALPEWFFPVIAILVTTGMLALIIKKLFERRGKTAKEKGAGAGFKVIGRILILAIIFVGVLAALGEAGCGAALAAMITSAGFLGIVIGFAAQSTLANIFAGISIALSKPYLLGDALLYKGDFGYVEDVGLRHTIIRTWDNRRIIIPNSVIDKEPIINYAIEDPQMIGILYVDVSYESDVDRAFEVVKEEAKRHPLCLTKAMEPKVQITDFKDSGLQLRLIAKTKNQGDAFQMCCDLRKSILKRFREEGIEIAYPRRYVILDRAEASNKKRELNRKNSPRDPDDKEIRHPRRDNARQQSE